MTINQFDDDGALKGVLERVIDITVYQPSEVDDFTFITSFDEEVPVLYNNQTYEKFTSVLVDYNTAKKLKWNKVLYSFKTLVAHILNSVAFLKLILYPTAIIASRL